MKAISNSAVDIRTDMLTRRLYANDASMYEELPQAVAFPRNANDIRYLVRWAADLKMPITARAAGTSLAGQTTGGGLIMDTSRFMTDIQELDVDNHRVWVQPGVIRDTLNQHVAPFNLLYGPDTSTTNRCMIGGMIGNNSAGNFSVKYGSTRDHVLAIEAVLSDGSIVTFGDLTQNELDEKLKLDSLEGHIYREMIDLVRQHRQTILENSPHAEIKRRNTGYALDRLCMMEPFEPGGEPFNLAKFLSGSEGTLAMTSKAMVNLEPLPRFNVLVISQFDDLYEALELTAQCVMHKPAAVELVDDVVLAATKGNIEQSRNRFFLIGEPRCILITQLDGDDLPSLLAAGDALVDELKASGKGYHHALMQDADEKRRVWDLRKAGLGLLMGVLTDNRSPEFVDDTAVRVEDLPNYIRDFEQIMQKYKTSSVYYAHASVGELHLRPSIDVKSQEGLDKMKAIAAEVALIIRKYRGSFSGEHGDGRIRAPFLEQVLGREIIDLFERVKEIWDPSHLFNPNKIIYPKPMDTDLRFGPDYKMAKVDTVFKWRKEGGFDMALEACNGAGVCRKLIASGGTMCPSYRATLEERDVTRGRANIFRQLFAGVGADAFSSEELKDALSLCLSCKACKSECPANVDMARMKAEFTHGYHQKKGIPRNHLFFGNPGRMYPLAMMTPAISNMMAASSVGKKALKRLFNVHPSRNLPQFAKKSFRTIHKRRKAEGSTYTRGQVVLLVDLFNDVHDPAVAQAAYHILERLGFEVIVPDITESGRTQISKGLLDQARTIADKNVHALIEYARREIPIVGLEPSEILTLRDEYLDLVDDIDLDDAREVARNTYMLEEFLLRDDLKDAMHANFNAEQKHVKVHGHCHAKALVGVDPLMDVLRLVGYQPVDIGAGCCGMAGSFGYEVDTYSVSMQIGEQTLFPAVRSTPSTTPVCAHGFSCRHQIADGTGRQADHPAVLIYSVIGDRLC
jgi:FAD/FMN-containing dehydrogenase/Fe-S oxidoreductase